MPKIEGTSTTAIYSPIRYNYAELEKKITQEEQAEDEDGCVITSERRRYNEMRTLLISEMKKIVADGKQKGVDPKVCERKINSMIADLANLKNAFYQGNEECKRLQSEVEKTQRTFQTRIEEGKCQSRLTFVKDKSPIGGAHDFESATGFFLEKLSPNYRTTDGAPNLFDQVTCGSDLLIKGAAGKAKEAFCGSRFAFDALCRSKAKEEAEVGSRKVLVLSGLDDNGETLPYRSKENVRAYMQLTSAGNTVQYEYVSSAESVCRAVTMQRDMKIDTLIIRARTDEHGVRFSKDQVFRIAFDTDTPFLPKGCLKGMQPSSTMILDAALADRVNWKENRDFVHHLLKRTHEMSCAVYPTSISSGLTLTYEPPQERKEKFGEGRLYGPGYNTYVSGMRVNFSNQHNPHAMEVDDNREYYDGTAEKFCVREKPKAPPVDLSKDMSHHHEWMSDSD